MLRKLEVADLISEVELIHEGFFSCLTEHVRDASIVDGLQSFVAQGCFLFPLPYETRNPQLTRSDLINYLQNAGLQSPVLIDELLMRLGYAPIFLKPSSFTIMSDDVPDLFEVAKEIHTKGNCPCDGDDKHKSKHPIFDMWTDIGLIAGDPGIRQMIDEGNTVHCLASPVRIHKRVCLKHIVLCILILVLMISRNRIFD